MLTFNLALYSGHQPQLEADIIRKLPATGQACYKNGKVNSLHQSFSRV